jgi:hypothetical protein
MPGSIPVNSIKYEFWPTKNEEFGTRVLNFDPDILNNKMEPFSRSIVLNLTVIRQR